MHVGGQAGATRRGVEQVGRSTTAQAQLRLLDEVIEVVEGQRDLHSGIPRTEALDHLPDPRLLGRVIAAVPDAQCLGRRRGSVRRTGEADGHGGHQGGERTAAQATGEGGEALIGDPGHDGHTPCTVSTDAASVHSACTLAETDENGNDCVDVQRASGGSEPSAQLRASPLSSPGAAADGSNPSDVCSWLCALWSWSSWSCAPCAAPLGPRQYNSSPLCGLQPAYSNWIVVCVI